MVGTIDSRQLANRSAQNPRVHFEVPKGTDWALTNLLAGVLVIVLLWSRIICQRGTESTEERGEIKSNLFSLLVSVSSVPLWPNFISCSTTASSARRRGCDARCTHRRR